MIVLIRPFIHWFQRIIKFLLIVLGSVLLVMMILSFTSLPFWADYHLGIAAEPLEEKPEAIVILGGSGMPSENGLIRCYYGAKAAETFPEAKIIIALPGDTLDATSSIKLMGKELIVRGIDSTRIVYENEGTNTRWEALNIRDRFYPDGCTSLLLVTSPAHMYRSVRTFKKVGFVQVGGMASFGRSNEVALDFDADDLGGLSHMPDVGGSVSLRYKVWTRMHIQISVLREYMAISYYWLMGWI